MNLPFQCRSIVLEGEQDLESSFSGLHFGMASGAMVAFDFTEPCGLCGAAVRHMAEEVRNQG